MAWHVRHECMSASEHSRGSCNLQNAAQPPCQPRLPNAVDPSVCSVIVADRLAIGVGFELACGMMRHDGVIGLGLSGRAGDSCWCAQDQDSLPAPQHPLCLSQQSSAGVDLHTCRLCLLGWGEEGDRAGLVLMDGILRFVHGIVLVLQLFSFGVCADTAELCVVQAGWVVLFKSRHGCGAGVEVVPSYCLALQLPVIVFRRVACAGLVCSSTAYTVGAAGCTGSWVVGRVVMTMARGSASGSRAAKLCCGGAETAAWHSMPRLLGVQAGMSTFFW